MEIDKEKLKEPYQVDIRKFVNFPTFKKRFLPKIPMECFSKENEK